MKYGVGPDDPQHSFQANSTSTWSVGGSTAPLEVGDKGPCVSLCTNAVTSRAEVFPSWLPHAHWWFHSSQQKTTFLSTRLQLSSLNNSSTTYRWSLRCQINSDTKSICKLGPVSALQIRRRKMAVKDEHRVNGNICSKVKPKNKMYSYILKYNHSTQISVRPNYLFNAFVAALSSLNTT